MPLGIQKAITRAKSIVWLTINIYFTHTFLTHDVGIFSQTAKRKVCFIQIDMCRKNCCYKKITNDIM